MIDFWHSLSGIIEVELTSADPARALHAISVQNIPLYNATYISDLTVSFSIRRSDYRALAALCEKRGEQLRICRRRGVFWGLSAFLSRPVFAAGLLLVFLLTLYLPSRVLFVQVQGNITVSDRQILEAAENAGVGFWTARREIRSESVKNSLLSSIPQLQWAGVNTYGCAAVISVREKSITDQHMDENRVCSIVASEDGLIYACTATQGTLLCGVGDLVRKGQVLISGYTDCGLCIRAVRAEGEVYAQTNRTYAVCMPCQWQEKQNGTDTKKIVSLLVGKKRINFWKTSGNWDTTCGRIYKEYYITLPGGIPMPFGLCIESVDDYDTVGCEYPQVAAEQLLSDAARQNLLSQMDAGKILKETVSFQNNTGIYLVTGSYVCAEMIGRVQMEQMGEHYGKDD